jgi:RNA polymerase sigma factor (sigma-70 family)
MPTNALRRTVSRLRQILTVNDLTDSELLNRFLTDRDESAFAVLVRRHGSLVMGVARRTLGNVHDAEDVFQATFLFLAQKARLVINRQALPGWLYTVAYRTALAARARIDRRRKREQQVDHMPHPEVTTADVKDWHALLDEELSRLPEKYRLPVILCDLENRPRKEVCRQLRLAEGTLSSRLSTARRKLAERLTRRGLTLTAAALATAISAAATSAAVPPGLVGTTVKGAKLVALGKLAAISSSVTTLMKIGAKSMFLAKLKATFVTLVVLGFVGGGIVYSGGGSPQPKNELEALRRENELLKVNLRVTLEKIESLEKQVASLKGEASKRIYAAEVGAAQRLLAERLDADVRKRQEAEMIERLETIRTRQAKAERTQTRVRHLQELDALLDSLSKLRANPENKKAREQALDSLEILLKKLRDGEKKRPDSTDPRKRIQKVDY